MSSWSRIRNVFRGDRVSREITEEFESHIQEAVEQGRDPDEARRAFGPALRQREESLDVRVHAWLDSLRADCIFGWRQLRKRKVASAAAVVTLALAIGACTSAFRLIDALLLRPMPIAHPERLYAMLTRGIGPDGSFRTSDSNEYPQFRLMRTAVRDDAELIAASWVQRAELTYKSDEEIEKAYGQYCSGWMFGSFGLKPAAGRLFSESDDAIPRAHAVAVLSYDYWTRRFGRDPKAIGQSFRMGNDLYQIVGVAPAKFTGTEPGMFTDIFLPTMMHAGVVHDDWSWIRTFILLKPGASTERIRDKLQSVFHAVQVERAKGFTGWPKQRVANFLQNKIVVEAAGAGLSEMRQGYWRALTALATLVGLVLLIACANVANLLTAQAGARTREMALRVSIGAGRFRLVQMVLVESALLAVLATVLGALFAWWSAPFVVAHINPPDNPARLDLPADWRVLGFGLALSVAVTFLFGLLPALRASAVQPASALKGGEDPRSRRRLMYSLIAAQVAFCFVVHFVASLFISTFEHLANQPTGFSAERLLTLETVTKEPQPSVVWYQVADHLRGLPGVEKVALAEWPLLIGNGRNGFVAAEGRPPGDTLGYFLDVSPGWLDTMKIPLLDGRDFRASDRFRSVAIVNQAFARRYFDGANPVGRWFERTPDISRIEIVGLAADARYRNMREPMTPTAYNPFLYDRAEAVGNATFLVRTQGTNSLAMAPMLRQEVSRARSGFRVSNVRTQLEINQSQMIRERLIAMLALFFAAVALLLAGIGLYGVLDYSVLQRRRELGIRIAIGAPASDIALQVTVDVFAMVLVGAIAGVGLGLLAAPFLATLLYEVAPTEIAMLALPSITILFAAVLASLPAVLRAVRIDPARMLRAE